MSFIKDNIQRLLNTENVILYPVSARSALESKLIATSNVGRLNEGLSTADSHYGAKSFFELENFLHSFLDGSTIPGMDRMRLKLETPVSIADRLLSACETLVTQDYRYAKQDLAAVKDVVDSVNDFALNMETESLSWRRQTLSLVCYKMFIYIFFLHSVPFDFLLLGMFLIKYAPVHIIRLKLRNHVL